MDLPPLDSGGGMDLHGKNLALRCLLNDTIVTNIQAVCVPLLGTGILSQCETLDCNFQANPVRIEYFTKSLFVCFTDVCRFITMFSFTQVLMAKFKLNFAKSFTYFFQ